MQPEFDLTDNGFCSSDARGLICCIPRKVFIHREGDNPNSMDGVNDLRDHNGFWFLKVPESSRRFLKVPEGSIRFSKVPEGSRWFLKVRGRSVCRQFEILMFYIEGSGKVQGWFREGSRQGWDL